MLLCCHHPPNKPTSFLHVILLYIDIRIVCIITGHIKVLTHVPPLQAVSSTEATYLVVLLCITYDHTHLKVDMHPAKTNAMHPEIMILVRIFECRIQKLRGFICGTTSGNAGKDYHHLTCDLIETFQGHSPQDQVVETPTSKSQMIDNALAPAWVFICWYRTL